MPGLDETVLEDLQTIRRHVEIEARLIDDLLDLTRIARKDLRLKPEITDLHTCVRNALNICCPDRMQDITMELDAAKHQVFADPMRMQQIFWNILSNAAKFTPTGKRILIRSTNISPDRIRVEVIDQGIGIDSATLARVFGPFSQGDTSLSRRFGGLGIGLAITKALVEAHGGSISVRSDGPDQGTTITVEFALHVGSPKRDLPAGAPSEREANSARHRILLVEDHEGTRMLMARLLAGLGHEVRPAGSVEQALDLARKHDLDLLVSDIGLPDGSGYDLMRKLKDKLPIGGIAVTGFGMEHDLRKSRESGFRMHLTKPITLKSLEDALREVSEMRSSTPAEPGT
jgi:CheY-like chemotaxis protein